MGTSSSTPTSEVSSSGVKYNVVKIQQLDPVKDRYSYGLESAEVRWKRKKCTHRYGRPPCNCEVLTYVENNPANTYSHPNSFYGAFVDAYNSHESVILSPDDVWTVVCLHFSKYVNDNAEKMRHLFVSHEGKKKLTVTTGNEIDESQWDEFFSLMFEAIKTNTKGDITETLKANFSTTGRIEELVSVLSVMDSFKKYFDYSRCIPCCGISSIKFMGTLDDWNKLKTKMEKLRPYAVCDGWRKYIDELMPIMDKFIDTYQGKVDVDFWNRIMNIKYGSLGSGSTSYVSGWILKFFGIYNQVESDEIPSYNFDVPVEIDNKLTGVKKTVNLVGGFGGVYKENDAYRPQLSMIVIHVDDKTKSGW